MNKLITINKFAQLCRTTPRTIRFYDQIGLLKPKKIDLWNGYRYYDPLQAREFLKNRLLHEFHIPLKEIKNLKAKKRLDVPMENKLRLLKDEIKEKQKEYKFLEEIKKLLADETDLGKAFKIKYLGPLNLFCHQINYAYYHKATEYFINLWEVTKKLKIKGVKPEMMFYLDFLNYNPIKTQLEVALAYQNNPKSLTNLPPNYYFKKYPKTKILMYTYKGPYEYLALIYKKIRLYLYENKIKLKGPVFENYIYGPLDGKSKYDYLTIIGIPI